MPEKRDVVVTADKPLYVRDDDRDFLRVEIQPGGQIWIETSHPVTIEKLVKVKPGAQVEPEAQVKEKAR